MRAVVVREFGPIESVVVEDVADPTPGPGEVLLDVRATAVNFVDLLVIGGTYQFLPPRPFVPGKLPTGIVAGLGKGAADLEVGDRVLALAEHGGYAEKTAVAASSCFRLPESMSFVDAAAMALASDTAWFALCERARTQEGETVLVLGASGAVGLAAVQLAKAYGMRALAGIANPQKVDLVRGAGADAIVDLARPNLRDSLREQVFALTDGAGADVILDPLGDDVFDAAVRAIAWRGRYVIIGFAAGRIPTLKVNYLMLKNMEMSGLQISDYRKRKPEQMAYCMSEIFRLFEAGALRPPPTVVMKLADARAALTRLRDHKAQGRIVLTIAP